MKKLYILFVFLIVYANSSIAQIELWGMTPGGGAYGGGNIFKTDTSGSGFSVVKDFYRTDGIKPMSANLVEAPDGKLYGMAYSGGCYDKGVIFQYDPVANVYIKKFDFGGAANGSNPSGSLILASDGTFYGMTTNGGTNNFGVLFQYDYVTNTCTKKLDFDDVAKGSKPQGSLIQASDGKLYGMTTGGGVDSKGVIFQYDPVSNNYVKKLDFDGAANGASPYGDLMQASDGKLYGMTCYGGTYNDGVLFHYDPLTDVYTKKLDLEDSGGGGYNPTGGLLQAADGNLYGLMKFGGTNNRGVLFQYVPTTGVYTNKWEFNVSLTTDGAYPNGSLIQASDGNLYGMTSAAYTGGSGSVSGCIFRYTPSTGSYSLSFNNFDDVNGKGPQGSLMQASDGKLYGMTTYGGNAATGVLFQYDFNTNTYVKKLNFGGDNTDGTNPAGTLIKASNGKLYGTTRLGGIYNLGILFEYDPATAVYTKKYDFSEADGYNAYSSMMQATDGNLYGLTYQGGIGYASGSGGYGVLFQYNPVTSTYTTKFYFDGPNGAKPIGSLIQASNGKFYGTTCSGGAYGKGVLYEYDPVTGIYTKKMEFPAQSSGNVTFPLGSLVQAGDGKLYGTTSQGGQSGVGGIFQYDLVTGIYTKKFDFGSAGTSIGNGSFDLLLATDGKLYGTTGVGGANNSGVLFHYDCLTSTLTKKVDFDVATGREAIGSLMQASDGKLYGTTLRGGSTDNGVVFQYDILANTYSKKYDFDAVHGARPAYVKLVEITGSVATGISSANGLALENLFSIAPNPATDKLIVQFNGKLSPKTTIKIMDVIGKEVLNEQMNDGMSATIVLDNFKPGLYFIEIQSGKDKAVKKFIKQ